METIIYNNFVDIPKKDGIFALLNVESCFACSEFLKEIKHYNKEYWTIVALSDDDIENMTEAEKLNPPVTRIYVNNKIEYEVAGVLYDKQMRELFRKAASLGLVNEKGQQIKTEQSFNVRQMKQRAIDVQCMQATEYLNIELLGKEVIAKKGQWIILYPDNHIEVLDPEPFERRFTHG